MRSILNGMIIAMLTMVFATWFLSTVILKYIKQSKSSSSVNNESITEKIKYSKDSMAYSKKPSVASYSRAPRQTYSRSGSGAIKFRKTSNPFGKKLSIRDRSNPFAPKLSLRGSAWDQVDRKRKTEYKQQYQEQEQEQEQSQTNTSSTNKSSNPVISGYQNYVNMLNEQMKD